MTNPTSNFGWQMPTATDLVTDLPADFEVFGQAVDTSMADLQGGTTGQILSKASNTNMDFTWITNDVGDITAVNVTSPVTGGGSSGAVTIGVSAASTSASGVVQLSDSTSTTSSVLASTPTATKSAYDLAASAYAPAFTNNFYAGKNKAINGDFNVNQRGFTNTTVSGTRGFDLWLLQTVDGTVTYSAQTFTAGTAPVVGYESTNFARIVSTGQTLATANSILVQRIEDVKTFANQTATVSFWAKAASGTPKVAVELQQFFGTSGSASVNTYGGQVTLSTSWARYSVTFSGASIVPSIAGKTITSDSSLRLNLWTSAGTSFNARTGSLGIQSATIDFWGVQAEAGSTATPFQTASGSIGGELSLCQRYFQTFPSDGASSGAAIGQFYSTTAARLFRQLPVTMRAAGTITLPTVYASAIEEIGVAFRTPTAFSYVYAGPDTLAFDATGMTGGTANAGAIYVLSNKVSASAEL